MLFCIAANCHDLRDMEFLGRVQVISAVVRRAEKSSGLQHTSGEVMFIIGKASAGFRNYICLVPGDYVNFRTSDTYANFPMSAYGLEIWVNPRK